MSKNASKQIKQILSENVGGKKSDWKRLSKKKSSGTDIQRVFQNEKMGQKIEIYERSNGLLYAALPDGKELTSRLPFNKAAKPSAIDIVMNAMLEDKDAPKELLAQALKDGLAKNFSFIICKYDTGSGKDDEESLFANIFPTLRDPTFKCPDYIRPIVPEANDTDECCETEWRFPKTIDSPAKIAEFLTGRGLTLDKEMQKKVSPKIYKEIKAALKKDKKQPQPKK